MPGVGLRIKPGGKAESTRAKDAEMGVNKLDRIFNEIIRGPAKVEQVGDKVREVKVHRGIVDVEDGATRQEEKRNTAEKVDRCSEVGHGDTWCSRREGKG